MTTETRYIDITSYIPDGQFYDAIGNIIPYKSDETQFRLLTNNPNTVYQILINDTNRGFVTTDSNGNAIFNAILPLGDIIIKLLQEASTNKIITYVTTKNFSVWHASIAEQIELVDDYIESTLKSYRLAEAETTDIDLAHGVRLLTPNEFNANLETYREILQFMRQAFRQFGGRLSGKYAVIAAITQVNPFIFFRSSNAPRWILGSNKLPNGDFQESIHPLDGTDLITEINSIGNFVSLIEADSYVNTGTGILTYNKHMKRFKWIPPNISKFVPILSTPRFYDNIEISSDNRYSIISGKSKAYFDSLYLPSGISSVDGSRLYLNIDNRGIFATEIQYDLSIGSIVDTLNSYIKSRGHYLQYREVTAQPTGTLAEYLEIIAISDHTLTNVNPAIESALGYIDSDGSGNIAYRSQTDVLFGPYIAFTPGDITRLYSDNGIEYVDVFVGFSTPPSTYDYFNYTLRYKNTVYQLPSLQKFRIESKNNYNTDGSSNIQILDGPFSRHRDIFGLDQKYATLQASVSENDTQITVPIGTMESFNSVNNIINIPFDVIIGRGSGPIIGTTTSTSLKLDPIGPSETSAYLKDFSGGGFILKKGPTHVLLRSMDNNSYYSCQRGIHPILNIDELAQQALIKYDSTNTSNVQELAQKSSPPTTVYDIKFIAIDPSVPDEINFSYMSEIEYIQTGNLLKWKPPNTTLFGDTVDIGSGGYFRLFSHSNYGYKWLDCYVDPTNLGLLPDTSGVKIANLHKFVYIDTIYDNLIIEFWSSGEIATVIDVTPSGSNEIWTLKNPIKGNYNIADGIFEVIPKTRTPPTKSESEDTFGNLTIDVDISEEPSLITSEADIVIGNPKLPTGWIDKSTSSIEFVMTPEAKFSKGAILIDNNTNDVIFEHNIPFNNNQCGFLFIFKVWVRNIAPDGHALEFKLGFDFGSGLIESSSLIVSDPDDTMQYPQILEFSQILPPNATQFKVQIRRTTGGSGAEKAIIERAILLQESFDSLYIGDGTIPRSGGRSNFGSLLYVWSSDELSTNEKNILGLDAPSISGLIRNVHNAHEQIDVYDVTDILSSNVTNVRGSINEIDWLNSILTNLEIISRSPTRFSHLIPIHISQQENEEIQFTQITPYTANLLFESNEDQDNSILYENGIPLPNNQWQFNSSLEIEIISGFVPGAIYTIEYQLLTRAETAAIDLDVPPNNGNDTWFADYLVWNRHISDVSSIKETSSIFFNAAFEATLPRRSDKNKLQSILTEDIGITSRTIPLSAWKYVDSLTIRIDGNQYNPKAIYNLEYNQQLINPTRSVNVISEVRSANTVFSLSTSVYYEFNINDAIDSSKRFHQIRLTFENIANIKDLKVYSAVIKGLNMIGSGSPPPGL